MSSYASWHGTTQESRDLQRAVNRHCDCRGPQRCAAHEMLAEDQRAVDGLLFARRIARRLMQEELRASRQLSEV